MSERGRGFADALRALRQEQGLTHTDLAATAKLSPNLLHEIEEGDYLPTADTVERLAGALDVEVDSLKRLWLDDDMTRWQP